LRDEGAIITNIVPGSPADAAGIAPGSQLLAVDGRKYSKDLLQSTLNADASDTRVIKLLIQKDDSFRMVDLHYAGKARYPRLERDATVPDLLSAIMAPRTP
jgi:predicted metalloprotease with PDZ domain